MAKTVFKHDMSKLVGKLNRLSGDCPKAIDRTVTRTADAVQVELIPATPVKTGLAQSNWQMGIDKAPTGVVTHLSPMTAVVENKGVLRQFSSKNNSAIYLVNNVYYIDQLNMGSSKQQPKPMFVQRAVARGLAQVNAMDINDLIRRVF